MYGVLLSNPWMIGLLLLFIGILTGYAIGRRVGHRQGVAEGLAFAPLDLRRITWEQGRCVLCGESQTLVNTEATGDTVFDNNINSQGQSDDSKRGHSMTLRFTKMHGLGNSYIFIDLVTQEIDHVDWSSLAKHASDANVGLGSDGLILILPGYYDADFTMRIFNADGSEGKMCGNGIRSLGKYVYDQGLVNRSHIVVDTLGGRYELDLTIVEDKVQLIRVDMGIPVLTHHEHPSQVAVPGHAWCEQFLEIDGQQIAYTAVSMGNPHAVTFVDSVNDFPVTILGPHIEKHPRFPERTNTEFVQVISPDCIQMRVWERGSGETQACGTGACAAVVAASLKGLIARQCQVRMPGGVLHVEWMDDSHIFMTGSATTVATGELTAEWLASSLEGFHSNECDNQR